jgi:sugar/nucleoside kinase (ribokinase family)
VVKEDLAATQDQATALRHKLGINQVVIHWVKLAVMAEAQGACAVMGPYCPQPKKSTGAGDRFNAGYCCGLMLGLSSEASLLLGCAASGFFVRQARSATCQELMDFIGAWAAGKSD